MTGSPPRWYELRSGMFALIYAIGFLGGWAISVAQKHGYTPAFAQLAIHYANGGTAVIALAGLAVVGIAVAIRLSASSYLSESRVWSADVNADVLCIAGPFRYCRHPLYAANILLAIGIGSLAPAPGWIFIVAANVAFVWALVIREERMLSAAHPEYARYRRSVPALLPRVPPVAPNDSGMRPSLERGLRTESFSLFIIAGLASFFVVPRYGWWILGAAYVAGVLVQRRIES